MGNYSFNGHATEPGGRPTGLSIFKGPKVPRATTVQKCTYPPFEMTLEKNGKVAKPQSSWRARHIIHAKGAMGRFGGVLRGLWGELAIDFCRGL